jgi:uncharacterized membrane protein YfcA
MIEDAGFYAVAVPAVVLMGLSKSGFGAGFGALCVPLMALAVPVPQAAAIFLPLLLVMDALGVAALVKEADRGLIRLLLPAGLLGTLLGTLLFGRLSASAVAGVVGALTLGFVALRVLRAARADAPPPPRWLGFALGTVSGFTSFVAHAGGPPIGLYVLPLRLEPITVAATLAVFFAAVNLSKWLPYWWLGLIDARNLLTSLALLPFAPVGVWLGVKLARRISRALFERVFVAAMLATGIKLLVDGLRG